MMDSVQWLEMMAEHSCLTDCKPHFARIAEEIRQLRKHANEYEIFREMILDVVGEAERRILGRLDGLGVKDTRA